MFKNFSNTTGVSVLFTMLVISAVVLMVATTATLMGLDESMIALRQTKGLETFMSADGCVEESLVRLNSNWNYTGGDIFIHDVLCTMTINGTGNYRTIRVTSIKEGLYTRDIQLEFSRTDGSHITSWQELTN